MVALLPVLPARAAAGIHQFLDLGSGIPTAGNVHETARGLDPTARVAYVDHEAVAAAYSQELLRDDPSPPSPELTSGRSTPSSLRRGWRS